MKLLKLGLISLVIFCLLILGLSLLFPSHIRISRAININAPKDTVQPLVTDFRYWQGWNELIKTSSDSVVHFTDSSISSEKFHVSRLSVEQDTMHIAWKKQGGRVTMSGFTWYSAGNVTVVQWYFDFQLRWYPWEKFSSLLLESQVGVPMENSLAGLKKIVERKP